MEGLAIDPGDGCLKLTYSGEIVIDTVTELSRRAVDAVENSPAERVVLDLSDVPFIDSSGIGFLVSLDTRLQSLGKKLYLCCPGSQVRKTLSLVQLHRYFNFIDHIDDLPA
ncbi:STAS domain-containing protein [Desulfohalovibrio reitneri]|uniref:STAS domain-containing protein n=1 Tax=Desulfohalovibrio reitneri TaxID=1307759 RepID=UPI0004A78486|nr:STAS domain-containing protein [Desulfohalovibrio reitneri]